MSSKSTRPLVIRILKFLGYAAITLICLVASVWAFGAIYYDGPFGFAPGRANLMLASFWVFLAFVAAFVFTRGAGKRLLVWLFLFLGVFLPWLTIQPSNNRAWQDPWAQAAWSETNGDELTLHNLRNFDYELDVTIATPRWESRTYRWSNLRGLDYFHDAWGGDRLAHPLLSFDFGPDGHVCMSIETRREVGEEFNAIGGLYRMFELSYLFGPEEDFVRVRTAGGNPVFLYRTSFSPEDARTLLEESLTVLNRLKDHPRFYNVLTANCTTSLRAQTPAERREKFDIRMLLNGRFDELLIEKGLLDVDNGLTFEEHRKNAHINEAALEFHDAPDFSDRIREGRPGFANQAERPPGPDGKEPPN